MLINDQQYILPLLRESMKGEQGEQFAPIDSRAVEHIIIRNSILLTVYQ